jgi:hypothetical protein
MRLALGGIASLLAAWRSRPTQEMANSLSDIYASMVMGGLKALRSAH